MEPIQAEPKFQERISRALTRENVQLLSQVGICIGVLTLAVIAGVKDFHGAPAPGAAPVVVTSSPVIPTSASPANKDQTAANSSVNFDSWNKLAKLNPDMMKCLRWIAEYGPNQTATVPKNVLNHLLDLDSVRKPNGNETEVAQNISMDANITTFTNTTTTPLLTTG